MTLPPPAGGPHPAEPVTTAVRVAVLAGLVYWVGLLLAPFALILIWAAILAVAMFPLHGWLARRLGGREALASGLLTLASLAVLLGPTAVLVASLAGNVELLGRQLADGSLTLPPPPAQLFGLGIEGTSLHRLWGEASANLGSFLRGHGPAILEWLGPTLAPVVGIGRGILEFSLAILLSGFLFARAASLGAASERLADRIVTHRGRALLAMAGATIRNVSRGVVGISAMQALLIGVGLIAAGVPGAGLITFGVLVLSIVQIGPGLLILGVLAWAWTGLDTLPALLLTLYLVPVSLIDNVLKPLVLAKGLGTPMPVVLLGVLGGTLAHGLVGLFLGPIVLAVAYDLAMAWIAPPPGGTDGAAPAA